MMMYFKPPRGDILLDELQDCVTSRLSYFLYKYQQDSTVSKETIKFQYLSLGSAYDRTGHYMLRLISAKSHILKEFIASSEAAFLLDRLDFLSSREIIHLIKTTLRHLDETFISHQKDFMWKAEVKKIFTTIKAAFNSKHMKDFNHSKTCELYTIKVPFQLCLKQVANRELLLVGGKALVPCGKWKQFLRCFCELHIKSEVEKIEGNPMRESKFDQRLQELESVVFEMFLKNHLRKGSEKNVNLHDLENLKRFFPPCMGYLYKNLKMNHRLSHNARFNLSLFLKDIGMSLNESLLFWQNEYSKPSKCGGKCSHSWQKNASRYTYSIRHMYGLEGRRANYRSFPCSKIQNTILGATAEGGCPFSTSDNKTLDNFLDRRIVENKEVFEKIQVFASKGQTSQACDYYRNLLTEMYHMKTDCSLLEHKTPVEYFVLLNENVNEN